MAEQNIDGEGQESDSKEQIAQEPPAEQSAQETREEPAANSSDKATDGEAFDRRPEHSGTGGLGTRRAYAPTPDVRVGNVGDQPTLVDALGFKPYVDAIANFLMNEVTKPPLTLSIEGEWGSGKSSFMLQLEKELREKDARVVRFNAWRHDKDDAMWAAFATEFTRCLSGELKFFERWYAHIRLFGRRLKRGSGSLEIARAVIWVLALLGILLVPFLMWDTIVAFATASDSAGKSLSTALAEVVRAGGAVGYVFLIGLLFFKVKDLLGNPLAINLKQHLDTPDYRSRVAFIERFHEDFARIVDLYGGAQKVCVFIDDLDRCDVPKAADLMQALNLMISDNEHLIFIMGMDREKVAAGLAVKYEKLLPYLAPTATDNLPHTSTSIDPVVALEYGYGFIEKFIQLPFVVPQASENQVGEFLERLLRKDEDRVPVISSSLPVKKSATGKEAEETVTSDTEMVGDILKMVAPTFEYNPRRLKQFINAFRLKTFIASNTMLFEPPADPIQHDPLTVFQLGKFVAICLRWPLLLVDVDNEHNLLASLQKLAAAGIEPEQIAGQRRIKVPLGISDNTEEIVITDAILRWYRRKSLRELLRAKLFTAKGVPEEEEVRRNYSLARLDVIKLLQVSPVKIQITQQRSTNQDGSDPKTSRGSNGQTQNTARMEGPPTYPSMQGPS